MEEVVASFSQCFRLLRLQRGAHVTTRTHQDVSCQTLLAAANQANTAQDASVQRHACFCDTLTVSCLLTAILFHVAVMAGGKPPTANNARPIPSISRPRSGLSKDRKSRSDAPLQDRFPPNGISPSGAATSRGHQDAETSLRDTVAKATPTGGAIRPRRVHASLTCLLVSVGSSIRVALLQRVGSRRA